MPLQTQQRMTTGGQPDSGSALAAPLPAGAQEAIGALQVTDIFGQLGGTSVTNINNYRIDRQNAPTGYVNLSVQLNGAPPPSTVASLFVPTTLNIAPGPGGPDAEPHHARMSELLRSVRRGLEESLATHAAAPGGGGGFTIVRYEMTGTFSA